MNLSTAQASIRPPAVASLFYPGDVSELQAEVRDLLDSARMENEETQQLHEGRRLKALIVPHAGYMYSGTTAAKAYQCLAGYQEEIKRVMLLGPAHRVWLQGIGVPRSTAFETPLGPIPISQEKIRELLECYPMVKTRDDAHEQEHCLEVQLPFLQEVLSEFELLPMLVGETPAVQVAELIEAILEDPGSLILLSTDLSHFHPYHEAVDLDGKTAEAIESFDEASIVPELACGAHPLRGLLHFALLSGWEITRLGLCNSGDTAGSKDRVVGYGAWALTEPST